LFQDAHFIAPAITCCHLPLKTDAGLFWIYHQYYQ